MHDLLQNLFHWISLHPYLFNASVFVVALMESLVVLGLLIPGAALLFGIGALTATGSLPLMSIMIWTVAGAFVGDVISFLLGLHYHQRLRVIWPFRRYPRVINRGVDFFVRHGGKSVFMARFIGPLRPIVPAIAGMMNMTVPRFLLVDIIACTLWAPVYILPGMVFGASLGLAAEIAGRLVVLLVIIAALIWLCIWIIGSLIRLLQPYASSALEKILDWSRSHPRIRPLAGSLLDPGHPEARGLAILSVLLFVTLWLSLLILHQVLLGHFLGGADAYLFHSLVNLHTPWMDSIAVFISRLGAQSLLAILLAGSCAWLFWQGYSKAAWHWIAIYCCTGLLTWFLKVTLQVNRPITLEEGFSFPSAHTSMSLAVYGFLALLIARELPLNRRWLPYTVAGTLVLSIALSRLYLGVHWFSDILAALTLGIFWVALIGIAYDRHPAPTLPVRGLLAVVLSLLVGTGIWQAHTGPGADAELYTLRSEIHRISRSTWEDTGWQALPVYQVDLQGHNDQPMNFQWAGSLERLRQELQGSGWHEPAAPTPQNAIKWLAPDPDIDSLPVLPQVHDGRIQALQMIRPSARGEQRLVILRLWPTNLELLEGNMPVWIGSVAYMSREQQLPFLTYLRTMPGPEAPLGLLEESLKSIGTVAMKLARRESVADQTRQQVNILLAWETAAAPRK